MIYECKENDKNCFVFIDFGKSCQRFLVVQIQHVVSIGVQS